MFTGNIGSNCIEIYQELAEISAIEVGVHFTSIRKLTHSLPSILGNGTQRHIRASRLYSGMAR